ncbi:MAG: HAMP domain-containing sensor histidine kinase [Candidatus Baltobacteraceae bacterium]
MPATVSQRRNRPRSAVPASLERRLFASYFIVFSVLLLAFALAIHVSFASSLNAGMAARLDLLLSAGVRSAHLNGARLEIKQYLSQAALLTGGQGLQWFDADGKLVASEGLVPEGQPFSSGAETIFDVGHTQSLRTRTRAIVEPTTGRILGWVRAAQDIAQIRSEAWQLDGILLIGGLCTLAASAVGGRYLQRRSIEPIRASYERLREFSADASHELRGPITAVTSSAEAALRADVEMRPVDRDRFRTISRSAQRMARLTDDLLLLARADQSIERELFVADLGVLVGNVVALYQAAFELRDVALSDRVERGVKVYGNPDQIERIFANLLENALHATPPGGTVEVASTRERTGVNVRVRDSGVGIDREHLERIFDRFWRAQTARSGSTGTGLGLPIARALARRHGGDVTANSRLGQGSEFVVTFPNRPPRVSTVS